MFYYCTYNIKITPPSSSTLPSTSGQTWREGIAPCEDEEEIIHYIRQNRDRLLYYIEETNEGKGFIKVSYGSYHLAYFRVNICIQKIIFMTVIIRQIIFFFKTKLGFEYEKLKLYE